MMVRRSTGLKCRQIVAKAVASCLAEAEFKYNWRCKVAATIVVVALARSTLLKDMARVKGGRLKTALNSLSAFFSRKRLNLHPVHRALVIAVLKRLGRRPFWIYNGKVVLIVDTTSYAKVRSRGKKKSMPRTGKVRLQNVPKKEVVLVPGYQEIWTGLLLKNRTCLGITRRLFTEKARFFTSQNALEEHEIAQAAKLVKEALKLDVIVVADRGFGRKDLLHRLKNEDKMDFIIRLEGKLTIEARGFKNLLHQLAPHWPERLQMHWREGKSPIWSSVRASAAVLRLNAKHSVGLNFLQLTPQNVPLSPMYLATSLPIQNAEELRMIVRLYSARWTIETFFFQFKESFRAKGFRVFSSWEAIDRLLAIAHMAFLVLQMIFVLGERVRRGALLMFWRSLKEFVRAQLLHRPVLTLGQFFETLAMDFAENRLAWIRMTLVR
jgi:hypothetical protein